MKQKVAIFDFACCEGCNMQISNLEEQILDLLQTVDIASFRDGMMERSSNNDITFIGRSIHRPDIAGSRSSVDLMDLEQARIGPYKDYNSLD